jgi:histidinol dehydrogenase
VPCERITLTSGCGAEGAARLAADLRALVPASASVAASVAEILEAVRAEGDAAVGRFTERFDSSGRRAPALRVGPEELERAERELAAAVRHGLERAFENVHAVARAGLAPARVEVARPGALIALREEPVARAALYVPGGRAAYPSTVVMGVATARAAGVPEIAVCSPPRAGGEIHGAVLAACRLAGADEVYRMGGAQAVAALAFGTETVRAVDVIVGPGSLYVQEAKRQLSDRVGTDSFAGPSDLMVLLDDGVRELGPVGLDMLAQAEHGAGTIVVGVSPSARVLSELDGILADAPETGAAVRLVHVPRLADALRLAEAFAPEHLQLVGAAAETLAPEITRAGCVFVGAAAGTAFGDYIAGSNHVLPTGGTARFASTLSTSHFRRRFAEVRITDPAVLARLAAPVARAEGFELHARSLEARIRQNRR